MRLVDSFISWGYMQADAAMRRFLVGRDTPPAQWPVPEFAFRRKTP